MSTVDSASDPKPGSFMEQVRTMSANFWVANTIEAFERLAFFGVRAVLPLYMVNTSGSGLGLSYTEKGVIYMAWALFQCLIPMVSGGYTDTYGYRKSMYVAFSLNICGYVAMASAVGFWSMMAAALLVGTGTAIFKPPVQGTVAKSLNASNSGLGFGIFYWIVNVGGFLAPMAGASLRGNEANPTWSHVFYGAAIVTAINFIPATFFFREPILNAENRKKSPLQVFKDTMGVLWKDQAMLRFLLIVSGFWFMFMQLWDLLPNFLDEWVDARGAGSVVTTFMSWFAGLFAALPVISEPIASFGQGLVTVEGALKPEMIINIDSAAIIILVMPLSMVFARYKMMTALVLGMAISVIGFVGAGLTPYGGIAAIMVFVFAIGEIICSPKFSEYIGMTAPSDQKALYMGYSNIPFAIGWAGGSLLSGVLYDAFSSKVELARRYLVDVVNMPSADALALPKEQVLAELATRSGMDPQAINEALWSSYHPWIIWILLGLVGVASLAGMIWNYRKAQRAVTPSVTSDSP